MPDRSSEGGASSAVPEHLIAYSRAALEIDEQIHQLGLRLGRILDAYRATNPEFGDPIPRIEDDLLRYAQRCRAIDERVGRIGVAFELAGSGEDGSVPAGQPLVVADAALGAALSAVDSAASSAIHGLEEAGSDILQATEHAVSDIGHAENDVLGAFAAGARDLAGAVDSLVDGLTAERIPGTAVGDTPDARVRDALDTFHQHLESSSLIWGERSELESIDHRLRNLSPSELNLVLASLSDQDLQEWSRRIFENGGFLTHQHGLSEDDREDLVTTLLGSASSEQTSRLRRVWPFVEPRFATAEVHPDGWQSGADFPLFGSGNGLPDPEKDINQGGDGDCWFLSALGAVAERDPSLLARHIHANDNGTFTVTFYRDGHPVRITVTDAYPSGQNGWGGFVYSHTASGSGKWPMIYEKAYARFKGQYASIDGGYERVALADLTGVDADSGSTQDHSLADIGDKVARGYAITSASQHRWQGHPEIEGTPGGAVAHDHAYYVRSVNTDSHPPTITLVNPWGGGGDTIPTAPQCVTLTEQQWHEYFATVSYARVGG